MAHTVPETCNVQYMYTLDPVISILLGFQQVSDPYEAGCHDQKASHFQRQ